jgi:CBS domain containing-hemolysin-like protein
LEGTLDQATTNRIVATGHSRIPILDRHSNLVCGIILVKNLVAIRDKLPTVRELANNINVSYKKPINSKRKKCNNAIL